MCTILVNTFIPLWWICFGIPWFPWSNARNWTNSAMIRSLKLFMQSPSVHLYILHCKQISHVHITCIFCTICISADLLTICKNNFANTNKSNKMIIKIFLNWSINFVNPGWTPRVQRIPTKDHRRQGQRDLGHAPGARSAERTATGPRRLRGFKANHTRPRHKIPNSFS